MNIRNKFLWFAVASSGITLVIISIVLTLFWNQLPPNEQTLLLKIGSDYFIYIFSGFLLFLGIAVFVLDSLFHIYIIPITRLIENAGIIRFANPSHRLKIEGSKEIERLAELINEGADRYENLLHDVEGRICLATAETEAEKNILAAILKELPQGVLICNAEGQILLYNNQAKDLLGNLPEHREHDGVNGSEFIGLGRSVFGIIDKGCVVHAMDDIAVRLENDNPNPTTRFVIAGGHGNLLKVEVVPILDTLREMTGFILLLQDITNKLEKGNRLIESLNRLTTGLRQPSAGIRSAIETVIAYPDLGKEQRKRLFSVVHEESMAIGKILEEETANSAHLMKTDWPRTQIRAKDFAVSLIQKAEDRLNLKIVLRDMQNDSWIQVDSYTMLSAILYLIQQVVNDSDRNNFSLKIIKSGNLVWFDLTWCGSAVKMETLRRWCGKKPELCSERQFIQVDEIFRHHDIEIFSYSKPDAQEKTGLRLILPAVSERHPGQMRPATILPESRPEFYDFDMFNQPGQLPELAHTLLENLTYTVFDTETTGLNPAGGDEIIAIGAVRIVNRRLLKDETFDQLVDPKRDLPRESIAVHGIHPEMLQGQPAISEVLPRFQRFAHDTILVAHNAAFDMRMLQIKEAQTGVRFINPVLDTLLLSAVVHPAARDHNMEAIANRLGIRIIGRHTALGDAIVAGEIFLHLLPLLIQHGIRTLEEALLASKKTYYSRLKY